MLAVHFLFGGGQHFMLWMIVVVVVAAIACSIINHRWTDPSRTADRMDGDHRFLYQLIWGAAVVLTAILVVVALLNSNSHYWHKRAYHDMTTQHYVFKDFSVSNGSVDFGHPGCLFTARLKKEHGIYHVFVKTEDKQTPLQPLPAAEINATLIETCGSP